MLGEDTIALRAPLSRRMWAKSSTVLVVYVGTGKAPIASNAVSAIGYSGRFSLTISTRSPTATPACRRPRAAAAASRANSPQEIDVQAPPGLTLRSIGRVGHSVARRNIMATRLGHCGYFSAATRLRIVVTL